MSGAAQGGEDDEAPIVPAAFRAMPRWWSDADGRAWLDRLPTLLAEQCGRWGLTLDGPPWHGSNALVVPVRRGGAPLALRLAPPGDEVEREADALRVWNGNGTVLLHDLDVERRALLLERLDGATTLHTVAPVEALEVMAGLVRTLAVPVDPGVRGTDDVAREHLVSFGPDSAALGDPVPARWLHSAVRAAEELAEVDPGRRAVDGDLHHGQVLKGNRLPWTVVDPVLLRGDTEHDLARALWTRLDETPDDADVRALVDRFVRLADVPAERARAWIVVRSMSYLLWGLSRGLTLDPPRCRRLLALFA